MLTHIGLITQPTQRSLAKTRKVPIDQISKNDPEIGAVVVRGVEISGIDNSSSSNKNKKFLIFI